MGLRVYDPNKDEEGQDQQGEEAGGIQTTQGQSASTGGTTGATAGSLGQREKSSSGNFTNTQKYRQANQLGAQGMAQGVSNKIGQASQEGQKELKGQQDEFGGKIVDETKRLEGIKAGVEASKGGLVGNDNTAFQQGVSAVGEGLNVSFKGPTDLRNVGLIQEQAQNVKQLGQATQNDAGRLSLLKRFYNDPSYTSGQQRLDSMFLGGQTNKLKDARIESRQLGNLLPGAQNQVAQQVKSFIDPETGLVRATQNATRDIATQADQERTNRQAGEVQSFINSEIARKATEAKKLAADKASLGNIAYDRRDIKFAGDGNVDNFTRNISAQQLRDMGIYNYAQDLDLNKQYSNADLQGLIGRLSDSEVNQSNELNALLGQAAIEKGQNLQQGAWGTDKKKQAAVRDAYLKNIQGNAGTTNMDFYQDVGTGKIENDWYTDDQARGYSENMRKTIEAEALAKLLKQYGVK